MMTKTKLGLWFGSLGLAFLLGAALNSQRLAFAQAGPGLKIGVVDVDKAAAESKMGKAKIGALEAELKPMDDELKRDKAELDRLKKEYLDKSPVWSEDTKKQKAADLELKARSFQRKAQDFEDRARKRQMEALSPLEKKMGELLEKMATEQKFSIILDLRGMLIYYDPKLEITTEVIRYLDAQP
jgi:Skp family chaperone for outer membrane proteins